MCTTVAAQLPSSARRTAGVIAAAAVLAWAGGAAAQGTVATLVSNAGQAGDGGHRVGRVAAAKFGHEQQFTTGNNENGYTLSAVKLMIRGFAAADAIRVSLHGSDGNVPSGRLYVLTDPASIGGDAFYVFTAPANAALASETKYHIVVESPNEDGQFGVGITNSDAEDAGAVSGWYIRDFKLSRLQDHAPFTHRSERSLRLSVEGIAATGTPPAFAMDRTTRTMAETVGSDVVATPEDLGAALTTQDADGDPLTYSLEGADATAFTIDSETGQIRTRTGARYDYEARRSYAVTARAGDGNGGTGAIEVVIDVRNVLEPPGAPNTPTVSAASGSTNRLDVSWTTDNEGRPPILGFDLRYGEQGSDAWSYGPLNVAGTNAIIEGLTANTTYWVQVSAINNDGLGPWSAPGTGTTNTGSDGTGSGGSSGSGSGTGTGSGSGSSGSGTGGSDTGGSDTGGSGTGGSDTGGSDTGGTGTGGGSTGGGGGSANRPPVVERQIEDQTVDAGETLEVDIRLNFYDRDQRALDYTVESADASVATVEVDRDGVLTIRGIARGVTAIAVTAADRRDERVSQTFAVTVTGPALLGLFPRASGPMREGFLRVINRSAEAGEVSVTAIDEKGLEVGPVTLSVAGGAVAQINSGDLQDGNPEKGLSGGVGSGEGDWRLLVDSELDFEALSYIRTEDGFLTAMHDIAPLSDGAYRVVTFNPGSNSDQVSRLRLVNAGEQAAQVTITGADDRGTSADGDVRVSVPAGGARTLAADVLESGAGLQGALGNGTGKWALRVASDRPVIVMSLLQLPTGHLTNLSTAPGNVYAGVHRVPLFPAASDPHGRQGFLRVINRSTEAGEVTVAAFDDTDRNFGSLTLSLDAGETVHFNSDDLEMGNAGKGLSGSTGAGTGDWRLELSSALDIEVLAYIRTTSDGFLTAMHDTVPREGPRHRVVIFNPGSNTEQVSTLRLVNAGNDPAEVTIAGIDDGGASSSGGSVAVTVSAGTSRTLTAQELEAGGDGFEGELGNGAGKWQFVVESEQPVIVMSLLSSPTGHLTNLSTAPAANFAPAGAAAFDDRVVGNRIIGADPASYADFLADGRFRETEGADSYEGSYTYSRTGTHAATVVLSYDDGDSCTYELAFGSRSAGNLSFTCNDGSAGESPWRLVELSGGETKTYGTGEIIDTLPTGSWFFDRLGGGASFRTVGGEPDIQFGEGGYVEEGSYRYTCESAAGCRIQGREVTAGRIVQTLIGGGGDGAPDLVVESPSVSESDVEPGASFTLSATVRNGGDGEASATTLRYYRSTDATLSAGDAEVGTDAVGALAASSTSNQSISLTAPSTAGTYYYGACVDPVSGESDAGNNCSGAVRVTVSDGQMEIESFDLDMANGDTGGIVFANDSLYAVDWNDNKVYAYRASGQRDSASDFDLDADNGNASGIAFANDRFYVVDWRDKKAYAYHGSGASDRRDSASDFDLDSANGSARGIAFANDRFYIVDRGNAKVYAYDAAGQSDSASDFDLDSANGYAGGIAFANDRFYVVDGVDDKVYAYDASGERAADFQLDSANGSASGITFANGRFYIVDRSDDKVYAYPDRPDRPDLVIESTSASDSSLIAGESFTLSATVRNRGGGPSDATTLRYYRSANTTIFTTDREMGTDAVGGIAAAAAGGGSISLMAPSIAGTYYYGACVDSVSGESDPTNNCSSAVPVTAAQASDGGVYVRHESLTIGPGWVRYFRFQAGSCIELDGSTVSHDGVPYILISSKWQTRANSSDAWADVAGTSESSGRLCVYDPANSDEYRLVAEISIAGEVGKYASNILGDRFSLASANTLPSGITYANGKLYVVSFSGGFSGGVYAYEPSGQRDSASDFGLGNDGLYASGIVYADGKFYVIGDNGRRDYKVYAYEPSGQRDSASDFDTDADNDRASGIAFANDRFYVVDWRDKKAYAYHGSGASDRRDSASDFDLYADNSFAGGITFANNRFYVVDRSDEKVYAYHASGQRDSASDFDLDPDNDDPKGITFANDRFYVVDSDDLLVYVYRDPT